MSLYLGDNLVSGVLTTVDKSERIGQIIQSTIPLVDAGLHLLDGSLINGSGIYSDFVDYIASIYDASANYFCSESDWQTAVTTYGVCGKFVYDSVNNTVRLPKYSNKIYTQELDATAPVVGNGTSLGVTDGTKNASIGASAGGYVLPTTSTFGSNVGTTFTASYITSTKSLGVTTDPTKSGIIADLANITTSLDGYYYIVVATSTKTDIEVDIDEVVTDLNGKADVDLTNCTKPHIVETYVNGASWYRVYSDGWCEQGGSVTSIENLNTVTLLKPYLGVGYTLLVAPHVNTTSAWLNRFGFNKTVNSFQYYSNANVVHDWEAKGYIR